MLQSCIIKRFFFVLALLLSPGFADSPKTEVIVSAAASLRPALEEIKPIFETANPKAALVFNFGSSGALSQQIINGAKVDVFLSANPKQAFAIAAAGLARSNEVAIFLKNTLVLIVPKGSTFVKSPADLASDKIQKIALGEPKSVPAGQYATEALAALKLESALKNKFVLAKDVTQVLTYVEGANAEAGFVYLSDAMGSSKVDIAVRIDNKLHGPIEYAGVPMTGAAHRAEAFTFLKMLRENAKVREIFSKRGFLHPD